MGGAAFGPRRRRLVSLLCILVSCCHAEQEETVAMTFAMATARPHAIHFFSSFIVQKHEKKQPTHGVLIEA